eukprot:TRINITY_DN11322_c0_g2_i5.p4 TRINITY_DN11322_c0_g2~~TRINITY_DN11322_c0_g2_i5.p4  ORF type:complete len:111 (+),score=5.91 TRINITY_DN11322_c0_g2_i5:1136-1468(+)
MFFNRCFQPRISQLGPKSTKFTLQSLTISTKYYGKVKFIANYGVFFWAGEISEFILNFYIITPKEGTLHCGEITTKLAWSFNLLKVACFVEISIVQRCTIFVSYCVLVVG